MNQPSQDGRSQITRYDEGGFRSTDEDGDAVSFTNEGDGRVSMCGEGYLTPEALRWLSGERTPPPQPIKPGDRVEHHWTHTQWIAGEVLCVHANHAFFQADRDDWAPMTVHVSSLRREGDA